MQHLFISYRHESEAHGRAVRALAEMLQAAGIPVELDQFYLERTPGGPNEGWPKWCEDRASASECVLVVASHGWFAAFEGLHEAPGGYGAALEAFMFRQYLYDNRGHNDRIRLAFVDEGTHTLAVPERLRPWHSFRPLTSSNDRHQLIAWVDGRLKRVPASPIQPRIEWPAPTSFEPDIADRTSEWPVIRDLLSGRTQQRILLIEARAAGLGKSTLVRRASRYAQDLRLPVVLVDFKDYGVDISRILERFELELGDRLRHFKADRANSINLLRKDLRSLTEPAVLIFDSYETAAENKALADFLNGEVLVEAQRSPALAVIVAGQVVPDASHAVWRDCSRRMRLEPITRPEQWTPWLERNCPNFLRKGAHLETILMVTHGNPKLTTELCKGIESQS